MKPAPRPKLKPLIKMMAMLTHGVWVFAAVFCMVLALYVTAGRYWVGKLPQYRGDIERYLSEQTGFAVSMSDVRGRWDGLKPVLRVDGFAVANAKKPDNVAFYIKSTIIKPKIWSSLLSASPRFDITIDQPIASIEVDSQGAYRIKHLDGVLYQERPSLDVTAKPKENKLHRAPDARSSRIIEVILAQPSIAIQNAEIRLQKVDDPRDSLNELKLSSLDLLWQSVDGVSSLNGDMLVEPLRVPLVFGVNLKRTPRSLLDWNGDLYLKSDVVDWAPWLPQGVQQRVSTESLAIAVEAWAELNSTRLSHLNLQLHGDHIRFSGGERPFVIQQLSASALWDYQHSLDWRAGLNNIVLKTEDEEWRGENVSVFYDGRRTVMSWDALPLAPVANIIMSHQATPASVSEALSEMKPAGDLSKGLLQFKGHFSNLLDDLDGSAFFVSTDVDDLRYKAYAAVPGAGPLDGYLSARPQRGMFQFKDQQFDLDFRQWFRDVQALERFDGLVEWNVSDEQIHVRSGSLKGVTPYARLYSAFSLDLYRSVEKSAELDLYMTIRDADASKTSLYLPVAKISPGLVRWLDAAIISGDLKQGDILFRGPLKTSPETREVDRTLQLRFIGENAHVQYDPGWPAAKKASVDVLVNGREVDAEVLAAEVLSSTVKPLRVTMIPDATIDAENKKALTNDPNAIKKLALLRVNGSVMGDTGGTLDILRRSAVAKNIGGWLEDLQLRGVSEAQLALVIPLTKAQRDDLRVNVKANIKDTRLQYDPAKLQVDTITGDIEYDSERGLNGRLQARFLKSPVDINIEGIPSLVGTDTRLNINGSAAITELQQWAQRPLLLYWSGDLKYSAELNILAKAKQQPSFIRVNSDLSGVQLNYPEPLFKAKEDTRPIRFTKTFPDASGARYIDIAQSDALSTRLHLQDAELVKGLISYGSPENPLSLQGVEQGLVVDAKLKRFDLKDWQPFIEGLVPMYGLNQGERVEKNAVAGVETGTNTRSERVDDQASMLPISNEPELQTNKNDRLQQRIKTVRVAADQFIAFDKPYSDLSVQAERVSHEEASQWELKIQAPYAKGVVSIDSDYLDAHYLGAKVSSDNDETIAPDMTIAMTYLDTAGLKSAHEVETVPPVEEVALDKIALVSLPSVDARIDQLVSGGKDYGAWQFKLRPTEGGLKVADLNAEWSGIALEGEGEWVMQEQQSLSRFVGSLQSDEVSYLLSAFDYPPAVEGKNPRIDFNLAWPGKPYEWSSDKASGNAAMRIEAGRLVTVDGAASITRLLGVLNSETLLRRLQLDFKDLYQKGLAFDEVNGQYRLEQGILKVDELKVDGPATRLNIQGDINLANGALDQTMAVIVPVGANLILPAAAAGGLPGAATAFVLDKTLGQALDKITTVNFKITGTLTEPEINALNTAEAEDADEDAPE